MEGVILLCNAVFIIVCSAYDRTDLLFMAKSKQCFFCFCLFEVSNPSVRTSTHTFICSGEAAALSITVKLIRFQAAPNKCSLREKELRQLGAFPLRPYSHTSEQTCRKTLWADYSCQGGAAGAATHRRVGLTMIVADFVSVPRVDKHTSERPCEGGVPFHCNA